MKFNAGRANKFFNWILLSLFSMMTRTTFLAYITVWLLVFMSLAGCAPTMPSSSPLREKQRYDGTGLRTRWSTAYLA